MSNVEEAGTPTPDAEPTPQEPSVPEPAEETVPEATPTEETPGDNADDISA